MTEKSLEELIKTQATILDPNKKVLDLMVQSVIVHWQQTHALTEQSKHFERWGYSKYAAAIAADAEQEHDHARMLFERMEFYDYDYNYIPTSVTWPRHDIVGIINANLKSDMDAAAVEKAGIIAARENGDELTAQVFIKLLEGSEEGIKGNTADLKIIEQMGVDNFLTLQV